MLRKSKTLPNPRPKPCSNNGSNFLGPPSTHQLTSPTRKTGKQIHCIIKQDPIPKSLIEASGWPFRWKEGLFHCFNNQPWGSSNLLLLLSRSHEINVFNVWVSSLQTTNLLHCTKFSLKRMLIFVFEYPINPVRIWLGLGTRNTQFHLLCGCYVIYDKKHLI